MSNYTDEQIEKIRQEVIKDIRSINRIGSKELIDNIINKTDFTECPSSTRFHGNYKHGLMIHSYNVKNELERINEVFELGLSKDTIIITAYLHDLCKANTYEDSMKLRKNIEDKWEGYTTYEVVDKVPLGHAEKSIIVAQQFIHLTLEECCMIRYHMGGFLPKEMYNDMHKAMALYKGVSALQIADQCASAFLEETVEPNIVSMDVYNKFRRDKKAGA